MPKFKNMLKLGIRRERLLYVLYSVPGGGYSHLSHALKNTANRRPRLPLHILRYATGNMQQVVFHLLARNSLLGSICIEDFSKAISETPQLLRTITNISDHVRTFSEDFRRFSENLKKIIKTSENYF